MAKEKESAGAGQADKQTKPGKGAGQRSGSAEVRPEKPPKPAAGAPPGGKAEARSAPAGEAKPVKGRKLDAVPSKAPTRLKPGDGVSRKMAHKSIHPQYVESTITCGCGNVIHTRSTKASMTVGVCSKCHPFYSGTQKFIDTAGRVDRFQKKYGWIEGKTPQEVAASRKERLARAKAAAQERIARAIGISKEKPEPQKAALDALAAQEAKGPPQSPPAPTAAEADRPSPAAVPEPAEPEPARPAQSEGTSAPAAPVEAPASAGGSAREAGVQEPSPPAPAEAAAASTPEPAAAEPAAGAQQPESAQVSDQAAPPAEPSEAAPKPARKRATRAPRAPKAAAPKKTAKPRSPKKKTEESSEKS